MQIKVDHLEGKDIEKESIIREQQEEIVKLRAKMDANLKSFQSTGSRDELVTKLSSSKSNTMGSIHRKDDTSNDSSTRAAAPSSCRELSLIGHILDGLYLVQDPITKKVETVLCTFGTSGKTILYNVYRPMWI